MSFDDDQSCIVQLDSDIYEERFRVDRRKLEEMLLQVDNRTNSDCAEIFFQTIMNITDTHISWPSKLKIGAKSKKDPHIKVMGRLSAVQDAKEKILDVLDTKCNRVTLKMDVSHTEHSHVIGKGGNNIKKVMQETGCHIHFPDSNRNSQMEKSNQVSIAGQAVGAEKARAQIRELLPLVFMFDLPMHNTSQPILPDSSSPHVQHIQQLYNVTVTFKQRPRLCVTQVLVRGTVNNANAVKEGTASVIKLYAGSIAPSIPVSVTIEIAPQHHVFIMGRGGSSIQAIMQRTGATIHFPDQANVLPQRKSTVYITGAIDNVYLARQLLIGCLPLVLMFDIKDSQEIEPTVLASMMEELDVFISVKPKPRQSSKSVIVKSMERNGPNMFEARRRLLGLDRDPALPAPRRRDVTMPPLLSHEQLGCKSMFVLPSVGQDQNLATNQLWQMLPPHLQNAGPPPLLPSTNAATVAAHLAALPNLLNPALPPMDLAELQHQLGLKLSATHDYNQNNSTSTPVKMTGQRSRDFPTNDGISSSYEDPLSDRSCSPSDELYQTVSRSNSTNNTSCSTSGISSNGSDTLSNNGVDDVLGTRLVNMKISLSPSDSGSSCDLAAMTSPQTSSPQREKPPLPPPGLIHPSARKQSLLLEENIKNAHVPFCNSDSGSKIRQALQAELSQDKRAPGSDRPGIIIQHQLMNQQQQQQQQQQQYGEQDQYSTSPFNYEEKKLLATRAMQKKPEGESRFPTDFWAGLGFSKSMPDQAIREKLKAINARFRESQQASNIISEGVESYDSESDAGGPVYNPIGPDYTNQKPKQGGYGYGLSSRSDWSPSSSGSSSSCISHSRYANIPDLFSELGLDKYTDKFMEQEIDLPTFLTLSEHDLKELGITKFGARRKMLLAIAELNKKPVNGLLPSSVERTPTKTVPTSPERTSGTPPYSQYPFPDQSLFARPHVQFISQSGRW